MRESLEEADTGRRLDEAASIVDGLYVLPAAAESKSLTLYVAQCHYHWEGFEIIGVFSTRNLAEAACAQYGYMDRGVRRPHGDEQCIVEVDLDKLLLTGDY